MSKKGSLDAILGIAGVCINAAARQASRNLTNSLYYSNNKTTYEQAYERQQEKKRAMYMMSVVESTFQPEFSSIIEHGAIQDNMDDYKCLESSYRRITHLFKENNYLTIDDDKYTQVLDYCNKNYIKKYDNVFLIPINQKLKDRRTKTGWRIDVDLVEYEIVSMTFIKDKIDEMVRSKKEREDREAKQRKDEERTRYIAGGIVLVCISIIIYTVSCVMQLDLGELFQYY